MKLFGFLFFNFVYILSIVIFSSSFNNKLIDIDSKMNTFNQSVTDDHNKLQDQLEERIATLEHELEDLKFVLENNSIKGKQK